MDVSSGEKIRSSLDISNYAYKVTGLPGCGLAALNTSYLKKDASSGDPKFFNNTIWGSAGNVAVNRNAALICAACAPNYRPTFYSERINMKNADNTTNVNL
jgi:hypothetical protein